MSVKILTYIIVTLIVINSVFKFVENAAINFKNDNVDKVDNKSIHHSGNHHKYCQDPSMDELENLLAKSYKLHMHKIYEGIETFPPAQEKYKNLILEPTRIEESNINNTKYGYSKCSIGEQTIWHENEVSSCPHHFVEITRTDRFPYKVKSAVCNCKNCIGSISKISRCININVVRPVLLRLNCLSNCVFKWKFSMEYVPVACSCKQFLKID